MRVVLRDVGHAFANARLLFSDLNLEFDSGETYAIVGPSGSGKSTLLAIMAGSVEPATGSVQKSGVTRVGWVFQNPHGVPARSTIDHVRLPFLARGHSRSVATAEATSLLAQFGLADRAEDRFATLSGGERQRMLLARAMASRPDLLLVDEPTAQLDRRSAETVSASLSAIAERDCIVVVATHDPLVRHACRHVIDLTSGSPPDE